MVASKERPVEMLYESHLPLPLVNRGKVRDMYAIGERHFLIVTTDRLSAFDVVLPNPIPWKGTVLNLLSRFWFRHLASLVGNHLVREADVSIPEAAGGEVRGLLRSRATLVKRAKPAPIECVVRGYLAGSGWKDYQKTGRVCGHVLPKGLRQCERLPEPLFTPATKATTGHDENIDFEEAARRVGREAAEKLRALSIRLYLEGARYAEERGIVVADTKFEFGFLDGEWILIDEVLTPDSSRFWPKATYEPGRDQPSFDKQIVRNYLLELGWNQQPPGPKLPDAVVEKTSAAYREVYERLTGESLIVS
jgi:phosphoribosylaminoimidazole-succinocarboxamide synthase